MPFGIGWASAVVLQSPGNFIADGQSGVADVLIGDGPGVIHVFGFVGSGAGFTGRVQHSHLVAGPWTTIQELAPVPVFSTIGEVVPVDLGKMRRYVRLIYEVGGGDINLAATVFIARKNQ